MEVLSKLPEIFGYVVAATSAIYAICLMIPGDKPDIYIKKFLDITEAISRKPKK